MFDSAQPVFSISDKVLDRGDLTVSLKRLRAHGFTYIHFSQGWQEPRPLDERTVRRWQEAMASADVRVLDVHGPHPPEWDLWAEDPLARAEAIGLVKAWLKLTHALGGDALVYHVPWREEPTRPLVERLIDSLARLEEPARRLGVRIALENHFRRENDRVVLSACFERFEPEYLGFTFDSGHAVRSGNTDWLHRHCFDRLAILHLHDNEPGQDRHWLPWSAGGHVPWVQVAEAIAASPYQKPLQFEVQWRREEQPDHERFLAEAYRCARRLQALVEGTSGEEERLSHRRPD